MAILPTRLIEIEFDAGVWTDVSADFVDISTRRGRNRELGAFETGSGVLTLRNDTRKYDPDHTAGPYYGKLRPNRRVRFRATYSATTYPVMVAYIDRITQVYGGPNDAAAQIQFSDLFKLLNRAELYRSVYTAEVRADAPVAWYRLDDPAGSTTAREEIAGKDATVVGVVHFGEASLVSRDDGSAMLTDTDATIAANTGITLPSNTAPTGTGTFTYEFILDTAIIPSFSIPILWQSGGGTADDFIIGLSANFIGASGIQLQQGTTVSATYGTVNDGNPHHVAIVRLAGAATVYIDGAAVGATFAVPSNLGPAVMFGSPGTTASVANFGTLLDELALYNTALSAARVLAHYNARKVGGQWTGDLPGTRLGRILDLAAVPAADRNLDAGTTTLQPTTIGGSALAYAQKVEETELGELFVTRDGKVRFIGREASISGAYLTSLATLVDDDSGAGIPYRDVSSDVDEGVIVTRATVSREDGPAFTYYDAAAKAEFGWLDATHDGLLHASDTYSVAYAQWIVSIYRNPTSRIGAVALDLVAAPATMYPAILALEIGDRVTYKRKPQNTGAVISLAMRVEAVTHETGGAYWRTRLQLSPFNLAGGYPVGIWDSSLWDQAVWGF